MIYFYLKQEAKTKEEEEKKKAEDEAAVDRQEPEEQLENDVIDQFTDSLMSGEICYTVTSSLFKRSH